MIVTFHICDNCKGKVGEDDLKAGQFFSIIVTVTGYKGGLEEKSHSKQWCRKCVDKFGLLGAKITKSGAKPVKLAPLAKVIPAITKPAAKASIQI